MGNGSLISDTRRQYALCARDSDDSSSDEEAGEPEPEGEAQVVLRSGWLDVKGKLGWTKHFFGLQVPASVLAYAQQLHGRRASGELAPEVAAKLASPAVKRLLAQQRAGKAVLGWQAEPGSEHAPGGSRQALPLREVQRVTCTVHQRLLQLQYHDDRAPLLLRALTEADCAMWARCLEDEAGMRVERAVHGGGAAGGTAAQQQPPPPTIVVAHATPTPT
eukprot:COSAG01_NODE_22060_length_873_cov_1.669251_1_plen_219_part_00